MNRSGPWRITFVTNPDVCNLRCLMCRRAAPEYQPSHPRWMDIRLVEKVFEEQGELGFTEIIPSTLGEPLLYPELDRMIDLCTHTGVRMNLTTNGTFPGRGARVWAQRLVPVISDVKISWNGANAETAESLMTGLCFEESVQAVRDFIAVRDEWAKQGIDRCRVSFQVTANQRNVDQLPDIVVLAARLGVDRVKVNQLQVYFDQLEPLSLQRSPQGIERWNSAVERARRVAERLRHMGHSPVLQNLDPLDPDSLPSIPGVCPFLGQEAWIAPDGRFSPCPAPHATSGTLGDFGSLWENDLARIWGGDAMRALHRLHPSHPECRLCRMRRPGGA